MYIKNNGYISGSVLFLPQIRKMREVVELEKFQCRILKDNDKTREFKKKTDTLKERIYAFRYNNEEANKLTEAGKKENKDANK